MTIIVFVIRFRVYIHFFIWLLDKPQAHVSSLSPAVPGRCPSFLARTGLSIPTARRHPSNVYLSIGRLRRCDSPLFFSKPDFGHSRYGGIQLLIMWGVSEGQFWGYYSSTSAPVTACAWTEWHLVRRLVQQMILCPKTSIVDQSGAILNAALRDSLRR